MRQELRFLWSRCWDTKDTAGNMIVGDAIGLIHDSVKEGESVVTPLSSSKLFPPMVISMVDVGEETGQLQMCIRDRGVVGTSGARPLLSWATRRETTLISIWGSGMILEACSTSSAFM